MSKASTKELNALHAQLANTLAAAIASGEAPAAILNVARQFLKDNHIEQGMGAAGDENEIKRALEAMRELPYEGEVPPEYRN